MIVKKTPKILFFDVESSPIKGYTWTTYDANVLKVLEPSKIISVAWKFLGDKTTQVKCVADYKNYQAGVIEDKFLIEDAWNILNDADVVCAHNAISFDIKKLNARFIVHGMPLPSSYEVIDTLKVAKKYFRFDQNSLDSLGEYLDEGRKLSTGGFSLWNDCIEGDMKAWSKMKTYNVGDVDLLEKIYLRFRPYMDHPNLNVIKDDPTSMDCPSCQSSNMTKRGFSFTKAGRKQRYQCNDCGSWSTGKWEAMKPALSND